MNDLDLLICLNSFVIHDHHDHHFILHKHFMTLPIDAVLELNHHQLCLTHQQSVCHVHQHQIMLLEQSHCLYSLSYLAASSNHAVLIIITLCCCHICDLHINKFFSQS